jgi:tetratricopeptide (TPR) repeat protein
MMDNAPRDRAFALADWICAGAAAFTAWVVYVLTLAPSVAGEDAGELITAAWEPGIPHPPGYPLWTLLAHVFTWLPGGTVAWRVNLFSAFAAALCVGVTALLAGRITRNRAAGFAAALLFAFSHEFHEQAIIAEVYTLNALCFAVCLLLLWEWRGRRRDRWLAGLAVVYGLSLGAHYTMVLAGPLFAFHVLIEEGRPARCWKKYAGLMLLAAGTALLLFLYLPLRSLADPVMDWGNPETPANFWRMVSRRQYAFMFSQYPHGIVRFLAQMGVMAQFWWRQFGPLTICCALGLLLLIRRQRRYGILLLISALAIPAGYAFIQNFNFDREWIQVMSVFGIPAWLISAVGCGVFMDAAAGWFGNTRWRLFPAAAGTGFALLIAAINYPGLDKSDYLLPRNFGMNLLASLEEDAIFIPESDHAAFSALYLQAVEGLRSDVFIGRKYGYVDFSGVAPMPQALREAAGPFPPRRYEPRIFAWLLNATRRPLYFERYPQLPADCNARIVPAGLVYRALRPGEKAEDEHAIWQRYTWQTLDPAELPDDYTAAVILHDIAMARARHAMTHSDTETARVLVEMALAYYGREADVLNNAGVFFARNRLYEDARKYFREALEADPENAAARDNLNRLPEA